MNKDQKLLEEAYQSIYESVREPLYFGPEEQERKWMKWLKKLKHEVHEDGSVSIHETAYLESKSLQRLPFNFKKVTQDFWCVRNNLTSLEGAPKEVGGNFFCDHNNLTTLEGAPIKVGKVFNCCNNNLTSLKGAPKEVGGVFWCLGNPLNSLEGAPEVIGEKFGSDQFSDEDYRDYIKHEKYVKGKLDKEFDIDLKDF
jgi:hypothetical protein